ncbi:ADP-ribosylation factor-like protein 13B [Cydia pomonella]|uniref:ADP-ribosylation factor-like protein 13B n=1 Tax=Cydia pomonella TaxID=82600 RepID=UPI002ADD35BB|nr:ADP-ribosylation factor-like protein 13B [Cydia pomonella]
MGNCWACVTRRRSVRRRIVLILIGLDNAGKTKTVNNLAGENDDKVLPTVGFKAVNLIHKDTPVTIYDLGGGPHFRQIWSQYYSEVHGVIFVIDSSDFSRLDECRAVLEEVLSHDKISGKPILVLANKQDKSGALDDIDVVEKLNIEPLVNKYRCPTLVESYTAETETKKKKPKIDPGLKKGYHWLLNYIVRRYGDINLRVQTDIHAELERRRLQSKASQTFTADSENTQTGFENPNFNLETKDSEPGLIVVKPISVKTDSVDTTVTIESVDKPKLSPLFGRASTEAMPVARVELEPRAEFRKLSPIARNRSGVNHIDFMNRPHSSPTKKMKVEPLSPNSSLESEEKTSREPERPRRVIRDGEIMRREILFADRDCNKTASSDVTPVRDVATLPAGARPASASQLVRRQLEVSAHRRRLSLRYMRNKTSPERVSMLVYEPKKRHLDKGDFQHATN